VINGTSMLGKHNPRWPISNVWETIKVPDVGPPRPRGLGLLEPAIVESPAAGIAQALRNATAAVIAWLASLPRQAGNRLFAMNDTEAGWRGWDTTVLAAGLARQYRDPRFDALRDKLEPSTVEQDTQPSLEEP
jgi:hypothetical protein